MTKKFLPRTNLTSTFLWHNEIRIIYYVHKCMLDIMLFSILILTSTGAFFFCASSPSSFSTTLALALIRGRLLLKFHWFCAHFLFHKNFLLINFLFQYGPSKFLASNCCARLFFLPLSLGSFLLSALFSVRLFFVSFSFLLLFSVCSIVTEDAAHSELE